MPEPNILVIAIDGLRAAALGAYGNTSFPTPALDELAADSLVCDWCFGESVELSKIYAALWRSESPLVRTLAERGCETTLVTDDGLVAGYAGAGDFYDRLILPGGEDDRGNDAAETAIGRVIAATSEVVEVAATRPRLIWLHSRGMYGPWDAPLELQEALLARDEGDPPPVDVVEPPEVWLNDADDPDLAFRWGCAYAAQVMVLDACLAGLLRTIAEQEQREWLVVLLGLRGFPLGEHGRVGGVDGRLFAEQLHVPLLWRSLGGGARLARNRHLVSLADVAARLLGSSAARVVDGGRDAVQSLGPAGERAIRTMDWTLCCWRAADDPPGPPGGEELPCQLFVRPDDRWEANNVAGLCPDVVEALLARLRESPAH